MSIPNYVSVQHGSSASRVSTKPKETQLKFCSSVLRRKFSYSLSRTLNFISDTIMLPTLAVFKTPITVCHSKLTTIVWKIGSSTVRFLTDCNKYLLFIFVCSSYKLCKMKHQWWQAPSVSLPETPVISRNCLTGLNEICWLGVYVTNCLVIYCLVVLVWCNAPYFTRSLIKILSSFFKKKKKKEETLHDSCRRLQTTAAKGFCLVANE